MSRYIDIENAKPIVEKAYHAWNLAMAAADSQREINRCFKMQELCKAVIPVLEHIPTADVREVKRGKWIGAEGLECSVCGDRWDRDMLANGDDWGYFPGGGPDYCPNCGADMREVKE